MLHRRLCSLLRRPLPVHMRTGATYQRVLLMQFAHHTTGQAPSQGGERKNIFKAPPNIGSGRADGTEANPFKSWEHVSHTWLLLMCVGCLCAGILAGRYADIDESKLKPKFSKTEVMAAAAKQFEFRPDLAATSIRVAFVLAARRAGFTAETTDESCAVVDGLTDVAGVMNYLASTFNGSMEDLQSLAAIAAVKYLDGPYETILNEWQWGRNDTDQALGRNKPADGQQKVFSIPTILHSLGDLTDEECVALMACHSVGEFHETVSGVDSATHIGKRYTLSNEYFKFLLENAKKFSPMEVVRTEDNKDVKSLPETMVCTYTKTKKGTKRQCVFNRAEVELLTRNKAWRAIAVKFAEDEEAWKSAFSRAFQKMLESNFKRLRVYSDPNDASS